MNRTLFSHRIFFPHRTLMGPIGVLLAVFSLVPAERGAAQPAGGTKVPPATVVPAASPAEGGPVSETAAGVPGTVPGTAPNAVPNAGPSAVPNSDRQTFSVTPISIDPVEPIGTSAVENTAETPSAETPLSETAPMNTAPVNTAPVNTAPVNTAPMNTPPVNAAPVPSSQSPAAQSPAVQSPASPIPAPQTSEAGGETSIDSVLKSLNLTGSGQISSTVKIAVLLSILSLVPAILMMTTSFVRIITVLSILRQGLGTGQIPPTQVLTAIAVFLTLLVMTPTFSTVWDGAVKPYSEQKIDAAEALRRGEKPIRTFLWKQIERSGSSDAVWLFMRYVPGAEMPKYYEDIPWRALLPAFMLSELKAAFLIGFQILLPFLVIDLVVSGVMVSMGMMMLPPAVVTLPLKLLLFVLADGWTLVVRSLLDGLVIGS